jgi:hypothetical protein
MDSYMIFSKCEELVNGDVKDNSNINTHWTYYVLST